MVGSREYWLVTVMRQRYLSYLLTRFKGLMNVMTSSAHVIDNVAYCQERE